MTICCPGWIGFLILFVTRIVTLITNTKQVHKIYIKSQIIHKHQLCVLVTFSNTRQLDTRNKDLTFWIENFETRCLYAHKHRQYKQWQIKEFYSRICQLHTTYSIHILYTTAVIIYF